MVADESYRKLSLSKQYFNCRTFTHNKEWKELQNEYVELSDRCASLIPHYFPHQFPHYKGLHGHCTFSAFFSLQSMDEISALKSNDNSRPPKSCVHMITCNPKEGETDTLFVLLLHDREVIRQTCRQPNKNQLTTTEMVLM